jgi:hypothetical protein
VYTDEEGFGSAELDSPASIFIADVVPGTKSLTLGDDWKVTGDGAFKKIPFQTYSAQGDYDRVGGMLIQTASYKGKSTNGNFDPLSGRVIKDFYWQSGTVDGVSGIPILRDYGLQTLEKKNYPSAKYWQWSKTNRSDDVDGFTEFHKTRIYNANGGGKCSIDVNLVGSNTFDGFDEEGTMTIKYGRN